MTAEKNEAAEKMFSANFSKTKTKFCLGFHLIICFLTENKDIRLKQIIKL